jgi:hypothetical protein
MRRVLAQAMMELFVMSRRDLQDRSEGASTPQTGIVFASVHGHAQVPVIVSSDVRRLPRSLVQSNWAAGKDRG